MIAHRACVPLLALLSLASGAARAADVTEFAPMFRGDLSIDYEGITTHDLLMEDGTQVGERRTSTQMLRYTGSFSVYTGAAVFFQIPQYAADKVYFLSGSVMAFDPLQDSGTSAGTEPLTTLPEVSGGGLGGAWLGIRGAPFHRELFSQRGDRSSWLLEFGYRFKDKSNLWTLNDQGKRGGGPGASAMRFTTAFSTAHRRTEPYLRFDFIRTGKITVDLYDASGAISGTQVALNPASTINLVAGAEHLLTEYGEDGARLSIDFRGDVQYRTWQDIPSGLYLPSVLDASSGIAATQDEALTARGGVGLHWRPLEYVQVDLGGGAGLTSPYQIEHLYSVQTGLGAWNWYMTAGLRFRARDPLFDR